MLRSWDNLYCPHCDEEVEDPPTTYDPETGYYEMYCPHCGYADLEDVEI